jgi:hypothetical protein
MFTITVHLLVALFTTFIIAPEIVLSDDLIASANGTCPMLMCNNVDQKVSAQGTHYFYRILDNSLDMLTYTIVFYLLEL